MHGKAEEKLKMKILEYLNTPSEHLSLQKNPDFGACTSIFFLLSLVSHTTALHNLPLLLENSVKISNTEMYTKIRRKRVEMPERRKYVFRWVYFATMKNRN